MEAIHIYAGSSCELRAVRCDLFYLRRLEWYPRLQLYPTHKKTHWNCLRTTSTRTDQIALQNGFNPHQCEPSLKFYVVFLMSLFTFKQKNFSKTSLRKIYYIIDSYFFHFAWKKNDFCLLFQTLKSQQTCISEQQKEETELSQQVRLARERIQLTHRELVETRQQLAEANQESDRLTHKLDGIDRLSREKVIV